MEGYLLLVAWGFPGGKERLSEKDAVEQEQRNVGASSEAQIWRARDELVVLGSQRI